MIVSAPFHRIKVILQVTVWQNGKTSSKYFDVLPKKPAYQRFIARQQLRKYATVLEPLLGSGPRSTMEVQLEAVFSM
jgi:hypothetical protein